MDMNDLHTALTCEHGEELQALWQGLAAQGLCPSGDVNPAADASQELLGLIKTPAAAQLHRAQVLSAMLVDLAWEKLHTGHWAHVAVAWRDLYSLVCLIKASLDISPQQPPPELQQGVPSTSGQPEQGGAVSGPSMKLRNTLELSGAAGSSGPPETVRPAGATGVTGPAKDGSSEGDVRTGALGDALKLLDLGIMMGGPTFRPLLDRAVAKVEQQLHTHQPAPHPLAALGTAPQSSLPRTDHQSTLPKAPQVPQPPITATPPHSEFPVQGLLGASEAPQAAATSAPQAKRPRLQAVSPDSAAGAAQVQVQAGGAPCVLPLPFSGARRKLPCGPEPAVGGNHQDEGAQEFKPEVASEAAAAERPGKGAERPVEEDSSPIPHHGRKPRGLMLTESGMGSGAEEGSMDDHGDGADPFTSSWGARSRRLLPRGLANLAKLPPRSLTQGEPLASRPQVMHLPSLEQFLTEAMAGTYSDEGRPIIISGAMETWPAMSRWQDVAYLERVAGHRTVPVEVGQHYLAEGWGQQLMTLGEFIRRHIAAAPPSQGHRHGQQEPGDGLSGVDEVQHGLLLTPGEGAGGRDPVGYLAQHPLFDQIPALRGDILTPEYCVLGEGELQSINAWFGPEGTETPLHTDPHHNLLAQVVGSKYVRLYSPKDSVHLYPHTEGLTTNASRVDLVQDQGLAADYPGFPGFAGLPYVDCVLQAGQMLYIPPGWWHYVRSLSLSFSVSFWWR